MADHYDAVLIGAGHNSLAAALHLSARGWRVAVFERAPVAGGAIKTGEYTLPGFRHDWAAMNVSLFAGSPFFKQYGAELISHGLEFVPVSDPAKYRTPRMEDLFLHEAIPGHHFQLSLALENTALPRFRRYDANNAYVEGWALYCESLGRDLGLFADPYQYFGMLLGDMNRAIRLVVDTGMHAKGWTREQAMQFSLENQGGTPERTQAEIERYMAVPGQALGYKMGQLKIRELRARGEQQLGAKFDLRAFHDEVLGEGALPLAVLEAHLQAWFDHAAGR